MRDLPPVSQPLLTQYCNFCHLSLPSHYSLQHTDRDTFFLIHLHVELAIASLHGSDASVQLQHHQPLQPPCAVISSTIAFNKSYPRRNSLRMARRPQPSFFPNRLYYPSKLRNRLKCAYYAFIKGGSEATPSIIAFRLILGRCRHRRIANAARALKTRAAAHPAAEIMLPRLRMRPGHFIETNRYGGAQVNGQLSGLLHLLPVVSVNVAPPPQ